METFLQLVARDLYAKIGNDLSRTAIVFPNGPPFVVACLRQHQRTVPATLSIEVRRPYPPGMRTV